MQENRIFQQQTRQPTTSLRNAKAPAIQIDAIPFNVESSPSEGMARVETA